MNIYSYINIKEIAMSTEIEICNVNVIHEKIVDKVKELINSDEDLYLLADFFKSFGDSTRIKILNALIVSEMCVCDLSSALGISQSAVSHQLRVLKMAKLVKFRKSGKIVYYSIDDDHVEQIFNFGLNHIKE